MVGAGYSGTGHLFYRKLLPQVKNIPKKFPFRQFSVI
jgi:hypothetical protein